MKVTRYLLYPCLLMAASASAQNAMTSGLYGQNTSMAGVAVGMREGMLMNIENPAGLTAFIEKYGDGDGKRHGNPL